MSGSPEMVSSASSASFTGEGHHHRSLPRLDIALEVEDLLPGPEDEMALADRHREGGTQKGGLQMGMTVAVMPGLFMAVMAAGRNQPVEQRGEILLEPVLEL